MARWYWPIRRSYCNKIDLLSFYICIIFLAYRLPEKLRIQKQKYLQGQQKQQPSVEPHNHDKSWIISYVMREYVSGDKSSDCGQR